jgi:hypothetical protein
VPAGSGKSSESLSALVTGDQNGHFINALLDIMLFLPEIISDATYILARIKYSMSEA